MLDVYEETFKNISQLHEHGLDFSNLLVVDEKLKLDKNFEDAMTRKFKSGLLKEDFRGHAEKGTKDINDWVEEVTKGKIHKLFDKTLSPSTAAVIANALHFKSSWRSPFNKRLSHEGKFTLKNGQTKNVTYMTIKAEHLKGSRYSQNYGFENVQIPFDNEGRLWFGIMLPALSYMTNFDCCSTFTEFIHGTHGAAVDLTLPKFDISQNHNQLKEVLQQLGVKDLFDSKKADLSGIDGLRDLFVSDIAHKATVTIDENGAEAAAATGISISTMNAIVRNPNAIQFVVDRPFIFSISDRVTGVDLFLGLVYEP